MCIKVVGKQGRRAALKTLKKYCLIYAPYEAGNASRVPACSQLASEVTMLELTNRNWMSFNNERHKWDVIEALKTDHHQIESRVVGRSVYEVQVHASPYSAFVRSFDSRLISCSGVALSDCPAKYAKVNATRFAIFYFSFLTTHDRLPISVS